MSSNKQGLRDKYKAVRLAMTADDVKDNSRIICRGLMAEVDWAKIEKIHIYNPMSRLNEVDIEPLLLQIQNLSPGAEVTIISSGKGQSLPKEKFDLIVVPTLAFDNDNHRLGWGGGFYDKFLAVQPQALKIGVCFQNGFVKEGLPREPHDIPLDKIVTEV